MSLKNSGKKKSYRHTSTFYRKLKRHLNDEGGSQAKRQLYKVDENSVFTQLPSKNHSLPKETPPQDSNKPNNLHSPAKDGISDDENWNPPEVYTNDDEDKNCVNSQINILQQLREWALHHKVSHSAINDLLRILKTYGIVNLPTDSRTLLSTPKCVKIVPMGNGEFWYNGVENCLCQAFPTIDENLSVSLIFNVDGLPPFKSAPIQFWPILMKIQNMPKMDPMVVSIYCGEAKPPLQEFLLPFVNELNEILVRGVSINRHKIDIKIKYFVCDTPARSFIKGTVGFNAAHGCIKCTVIGEYDYGGRHMSYPNIDCTLRTNESFRNKVDEDHHKEDSPLLKLPIDMVKDIIIADSLHLFDLGLMRKCLYGWINGSYNFRTKLSAREIHLLSSMLEDCNAGRPAEIHRAIRDLKCLKFWKGAEFRTFLLYLGPVLLKDIISNEAYHNFLMLSCAVTILSCKKYLVHINVADQLLKDYLVQFINIYGRDSISSNVHNLCHVVTDVKNFGNLSDISTYPFENYLGYIKSLIRTGNRPLPQVVKRVLELSKLNCVTNRKSQVAGPFLKKENIDTCHLQSRSKVFNEVYVSDFMLSNNIKNKWFMTKSNVIVSMTNATYHNDEIHIQGNALQSKSDFFELPIKSSHLNIYKSDGVFNSVPELYSLSEIKCKLFSIKYKDQFVFMPLIHTLDTQL